MIYLAILIVLVGGCGAIFLFKWIDKKVSLQSTKNPKRGKKGE
jgi:hypothetical protein